MPIFEPALVAAGAPVRCRSAQLGRIAGELQDALQSSGEQAGCKRPGSTAWGGCSAHGSPCSAPRTRNYQQQRVGLPPASQGLLLLPATRQPHGGERTCANLEHSTAAASPLTQGSQSVEADCWSVCPGQESRLYPRHPAGLHALLVPLKCTGWMPEYCPNFPPCPSLPSCLLAVPI